MTTERGSDAAGATGVRTDPAQARGGSALAWLRALRPEQWLKNGFVLSPLVFSGKGTDLVAIEHAVAAFAAFCAVASAVYLVNDVVDRNADRQHPRKRLRPIAAGLISPGLAIGVAMALGAGGLLVAWYASRGVVGVLAVYLVVNALYGLWLKQVVIIDVFVVASFFIMRLVAGSSAVGVSPSIWLLLCGGLLALYLGFAKRRHELMLLGATSPSHRAVLAGYSTPFLDQLSVVLLSVTVVSYVMYTLESETARAVGSDVLSYSIVFVLYGVLRYLYLVQRNEGGNPSETLLTDRSLLAAATAWAAYCVYVIYIA